ncbi:MAG: F0F1 ATP synthase subunit A [Bdellovibrionaceae bacterium]|nr:F0F1 ATP synthase subunit A [Pseudobdellovibrionaceae bacterium]
MGSHFTWFDLAHVDHHYTYVAVNICVTVLLVMLSLAGNLALGKGEAAIRPASHFSLKGLFEALTEFIVGIVKMVFSGHGGMHYVAVFGPIFTYIIFNNLFGLIPGMTAATANINAAIAIGVCSFIYYNIEGFKHAGLHYLQHFAGPSMGHWLATALLACVMVPIELISNFIRPFSLGIRLSVNMTADHTILGTFIDLTKAVIPVIFYGMGTFVSFVQAFVFTLLSMVYVIMATADDH